MKAARVIRKICLIGFILTLVVILFGTIDAYTNGLFGGGGSVIEAISGAFS